MLADDATQAFAFAREYQGQNILVVLNSSDKARTLTLPAKPGIAHTDLLNDFKVTRNADTLTLTVPAKWGAILLAQ